MWDDITRTLSKKYSTLSFRIDGDTRIVAEKRELLQLGVWKKSATEADSVCLITGNTCNPVDTTTATMIPGSQATAKLVSFQVKQGYDSYGKDKCRNAPISESAEFAYTTALNTMLRAGSRNNLAEAVAKSIFQGLPYPATLFAACLRRVKAEGKLTTGRAAILKAYLNRINTNS